MSEVRRVRSKIRYRVLDKNCLGRDCFAPGQFQHRGAMMGGGSRNTGGYSYCCLNNAYHGCPDPIPDATKEKKQETKKEGWREA